MRLPRPAVLTAMLLLGMASLACAEQIAELSDEFLEYLGSLEGDDEDWTDFVAASVPTQASSSSGAALAKASSSSSSSAAASTSTSVVSKAVAAKSDKAER